MRIHHHNHHMRRPFFGGAIKFVLGSCFLSLVLGYPLMLLWNWIAVGIFHAPVITYIQGAGIFLLSRFIMGPIFPLMPMKHFSYHHHGDDDDDDEFHGLKKWHYYDRFWKEEGKEAFKSYIEKLKAEKEAQKKTQG
jgi:hypothetical protein